MIETRRSGSYHAGPDTLDVSRLHRRRDARERAHRASAWGRRGRRRGEYAEQIRARLASTKRRPYVELRRSATASRNA